MKHSDDSNQRIARMVFASIYPLYLTKVERKGRTKEELDQVIRWLTGYSDAELREHTAAGSTFAAFFAAAPVHPNARLITGTICGYRVEEIEDPLTQKVRWLDKLVDELAKGRPMEKILRPAPPAAKGS
jgi:hypothetical protein